MHPPEKGGYYHTLQTEWGHKTESLPQIAHSALLKGRIKNALPSTIIYEQVVPDSSRDPSTGTGCTPARPPLS
jgi:hypothetical protein